ncbi:MAG: HEAT repeat domain-containing protein [Bacteroidetes bacterium]|nr:HEAT repeat domain-containing protein [Bacteroidota bacterium]
MNTKELIKSIISGNAKDFKRFELLENFAIICDSKEDIEFLVNILTCDRSSVVRHEAAAQLLKIEQKKPWVLKPMKSYVIRKLLNVVITDTSLVAKHESVEALSYIGDSSVLIELNKLIENSGEDEISDTIQLAIETIEYRIVKNINAHELSDAILSEAIKL